MRIQLSSAAGLLASVAICGSGPARAADLPPRAAPLPIEQPAPPPYVSDWSGFYIGAHGGFGWDHQTFGTDAFNGLGPLPGSTPTGGLVGGQAGYGWQYGPVVGGVEIDLSAANLKSTTTLSSLSLLVDPLSRHSKIDELGSARARLGWTLMPNLLAFGTAGIGFGHAELSFADAVSGLTTTMDQNLLGWVAGGGVEYKVFEHLLLRAEYLHYGFGNSSIVDPIAGDVTIRNAIDVVRGGISYKF